MKNILVVQHVPHENPGIIGPAVERGGYRADYIRVYETHAMPRTIEGYSALIVLGGPMGVYEQETYPFIKGELKLIESALKTNTPALGVCLGAQMMAKAAGAKVYKGKSKEIGWYGVSLTEEGVDDRLFMGLSDEFTVFQWHGDTFDIPGNASRIASSELFENQVVRIGSRAYGIQFHLEVTEKMIKEWIEVNRDELKGLKGVIDPKKIIRETAENITGLHAYGRTVIERFLRMID